MVADDKEPLPWDEKVLTFLTNQVARTANCIACGTTGSVFASEQLVTPMPTTPDGSVNLGGTSYPQIMLMCRHCGFTRYFNYILLQAAMKKLEKASAQENPNG